MVLQYSNPTPFKKKKNHKKAQKSPHKPVTPKCLKRQIQIQKNAYSPNALTTSNRIPAKADLQSPSHATLRLGAPLLFPADFRSSRGLESLPAVFR